MDRDKQQLGWCVGTAMELERKEAMTEINLERRIDRIAQLTASTGVSEEEIYDVFYNSMQGLLSKKEIEKRHPAFYHLVLHYKGME